MRRSARNMWKSEFHCAGFWLMIAHNQDSLLLLALRIVPNNPTTIKYMWGASCSDECAAIPVKIIGQQCKYSLEFEKTRKNYMQFPHSRKEYGIEGVK